MYLGLRPPHLYPPTPSTKLKYAVLASRATNPLADVTMSDIEDAAPENSLIDLSDNEIEIEMK